MSGIMTPRFLTKAGIWEQKVRSKLSTAARAAQLLGDESVRVDRPGAEREVVADFFADNLLTNEATIRAVCEYQPTTARGIRDYIKKLLNKLGGKQSTLEKAVEMYNKALKDVAAKAQAEAQSRLKLKSAPEAKAQGSGLKIGGKTQYSVEDDLQRRVDKAIEMLDNGLPMSKVFNDTEIVVMANGNLQDGIGGEIVGRYDRGRNDKGKVGRNGSGLRLAGKQDSGWVEPRAGAKANRNLKEWDGLDTKSRNRIIKEVKSQMSKATPEGKASLKVSTLRRHSQKGSMKC